MTAKEAPKVGPTAYPEALREARKALEELRYEDALGWVRAVPATAPPTLRMQALEVAATVHLVIGRTALAQPLLEELYHLAPGFVLDDPALPPRVTKLFDEEAARPHRRSVRLRLGQHRGDMLGHLVTTRERPHAIRVSCRSGAKAPFVHVRGRWLGGRVLPAAKMNPGSSGPTSARRWFFRLPARSAFACHAVALDRDGLPLGRLGTARAPLILRPGKPPPPPVYKRWYFWTGLSAAVVGGVVAAVVVSTNDEPVPPTSELTVSATPGSLALFRW